jgi:hypothetical protein
VAFTQIPCEQRHCCVADNTKTITNLNELNKIT